MALTTANRTRKECSNVTSPPPSEKKNTIWIGIKLWRNQQSRIWKFRLACRAGWFQVIYATGSIKIGLFHHSSTFLMAGIKINCTRCTDCNLLEVTLPPKFNTFSISNNERSLLELPSSSHSFNQVLNYHFWWLIGTAFGVQAINLATRETALLFTWIDQLCFALTVFRRLIGPGEHRDIMVWEGLVWRFYTFPYGKAEHFPISYGS